jgi:hypothetical protein
MVGQVLFEDILIEAETRIYAVVAQALPSMLLSEGYRILLIISAMALSHGKHIVPAVEKADVKGRLCALHTAAGSRRRCRSPKSSCRRDGHHGMTAAPADLHASVHPAFLERPLEMDLNGLVDALDKPDVAAVQPVVGGSVCHRPISAGRSIVLADGIPVSG